MAVEKADTTRRHRKGGTCPGFQAVGSLEQLSALILISYGASHDLVRHQTQRPTFLFWHFFVAFFANIPLLWPVLAHHPEQLLNGCGVKPSLVQTNKTVRFRN